MSEKNFKKISKKSSKLCYIADRQIRAKPYMGGIPGPEAKKQGFYFLQTLKAKKEGFYFFFQTLESLKNKDFIFCTL